MALLERADFIIVAAPFHNREFYSSNQQNHMSAVVVMLAAVRRVNPDVRLLLLFPFLHAKTILKSMPDLHMLNYRLDEKFRVFTSIPLQYITGPDDPGYRLCLDCNAWIFHTSRHCKLCGICHLSGFRQWEYCRRQQSIGSLKSAEQEMTRARDANTQTAQPRGKRSRACASDVAQRMPPDTSVECADCSCDGGGSSSTDDRRDGRASSLKAPEEQVTRDDWRATDG